MTTLRQLFSYDDMEDADIHKFLSSLPERQKSKYIRMAIRHYMAHLNQDTESKNSIELSPVKINKFSEESSPTINNSEEESQSKSLKNNDYVDVDASIFDLGK
ncbi:hypothetical protein [Ornithinibacillus sp. FSL M8-0202]|uniref:hypothetical protein n=1 Tax=Ornithinibacillus sp. FSL M8-0202 TaxID=2921616 RepID=UPI0030D0A4F0